MLNILRVNYVAKFITTDFVIDFFYIYKLNLKSNNNLLKEIRLINK